MDELVRRAAMDGTLRKVVRIGGPDGASSGFSSVGHVVCDSDYEFSRLAAQVPPDRRLLRQAMREEWGLAD